MSCAKAQKRDILGTVQTRKVSAVIPTELHLHIHQLARENNSTVGELVTYGLRLAVKQLKTDKRAAARLAKDHRLRAE